MKGISLHASSVPSTTLRLMPFLMVATILVIFRLMILTDQSLHQGNHPRRLVPNPTAGGNASQHESNRREPALPNNVQGKRGAHDNLLHIDNEAVREKHHDDDHEDDVPNDEDDDDDDDEDMEE